MRQRSLTLKTEAHTVLIGLHDEIRGTDLRIPSLDPVNVPYGTNKEN